jgi:AcrR family transcriptional regulator
MTQLAERASFNDSRTVARRPGGRSARIRRAVFDATLVFLAADGYHALSIEAVAAAAGVNKTTVYRNWPTKATLVRAAAEDRSAALITTETSGDPERDLVAFLTSVAANVTSPLGHALVLATLNQANDTQVREARADFWLHRFQAASELVRSAAGEATNPDSIIERLIAPVFLRAFITGAPIDEAFIRETVRAALASSGNTQGGSKQTRRSPRRRSSGKDLGGKR